LKLPAVHDVPLHDYRVEVWSEIRVHRTIQPLFFGGDHQFRTLCEINSAAFLGPLTDEKNTQGHFVQDNATARTAIARIATAQTAIARIATAQTAIARIATARTAIARIATARTAIARIATARTANNSVVALDEVLGEGVLS
jgi:hypothetical protein